MKFLTKINSLTRSLRASVSGGKIALAVRLQLTDRCNLRCRYCNLWKNPKPDLKTEVVLALLKELKDAGTKRISLSGGEPLLRDDIKLIIDQAKDLGISVSMNSNGYLVPERVSEIKNLDLLKLSLDGPKEIHDSVRQKKGLFDQLMKSVRIAQKNGIKISFACTITKYNIEHLEYLVDLARSLNTFVAFQPLKLNVKHALDLKNIYPEKNVYHDKIKRLISLKYGCSSKHIRNSIAMLDHIYRWPNYEQLKCAAGHLFCIIDSDGTVLPCDRISYNENLPNIANTSFKEAFKLLPPVVCNGCGFCGSLELSFLLRHKWLILKTIQKVIK
ncbi:MAG: radical SAM protein [Candidatus Kaelpia aquatica]|nr:radical SAM protein [Candidatus Kaelpia aquatica]